jgi:hypothetical protein
MTLLLKVSKRNINGNKILISNPLFSINYLYIYIYIYMSKHSKIIDKKTVNKIYWNIKRYFSLIFADYIHNYFIFMSE